MSDLPNVKQVKEYVEKYKYEYAKFDPDDLKKSIDELNKKFTQENLKIVFSSEDESIDGLPEFLKQVDLKL